VSGTPGRADVGLNAAPSPAQVGTGSECGELSAAGHLYPAEFLVEMTEGVRVDTFLVSPFLNLLHPFASSLFGMEIVLQILVTLVFRQ
jgi:hypothetical protein